MLKCANISRTVCTFLFSNFHAAVKWADMYCHPNTCSDYSNDTNMTNDKTIPAQCHLAYRIWKDYKKMNSSLVVLQEDNCVKLLFS